MVIPLSFVMDAPDKTLLQYSLNRARKASKKCHLLGGIGTTEALKEDEALNKNRSEDTHPSFNGTNCPPETGRVHLAWPHHFPVKSA
jgi:hypothetical protein